MGLAEPTWEGGVLVQCPVCGTRMTISGFPALGQSTPASGTGERAVDGDAACFFHPEKKASMVCDQCGRYICALCDLPIGKRHLCPTCLESGLEKQERMPELLTKRLSWGKLSLFISLAVPVFCFPLAPISGAAAVFCGVYGWNKPGSLVKGRRRGLAFFGILIGLLQVISGIVVCTILWKKINHG
jgi:B-box zinc finger